MISQTHVALVCSVWGTNIGIISSYVNSVQRFPALMEPRWPSHMASISDMILMNLPRFVSRLGSVSTFSLQPCTLRWVFMASFHMPVNLLLPIFFFALMYWLYLHSQFWSVFSFKFYDKLQCIYTKCNAHLLIEESGIVREVRSHCLEWDACADLKYTSCGEYLFRRICRLHRF